MPRKPTQWHGEKGAALTVEFVKMIPAFIASLDTRRSRNTGEILVRCSEIRPLAEKHGFIRIPNKVMSIAMIAAGGKHHAFGNGASNYIFEGCYRKVDLITSTTARVAQYIKQEIV